MLHGSRNTGAQASSAASMSDMEEGMKRPLKWSMGMLNDKETDEVPGTLPYSKLRWFGGLIAHQALFFCSPKPRSAMSRSDCGTPQPEPPPLPSRHHSDHLPERAQYV